MRRVRGRRQRGGGKDVRVGEEDAGRQDGGDEEGVGEPGLGAVEDVPEGGVDEGEGEGELEGGLPGEAALGGVRIYDSGRGWVGRMGVLTIAKAMARKAPTLRTMSFHCSVKLISGSFSRDASGRDFDVFVWAPHTSSA